MRFECVVAPYDSIAFAKELDVFEKGAFARSLRSRDRFPLILDHDHTAPIGFIDVHDAPDALRGVATIVDTARGLDEWKLIKAGIRKAISVGFLAQKFQHKTDPQVGRVLRYISDADLLEITLLVDGFAADSGAKITKILDQTAPMPSKQQQTAGHQSASGGEVFTSAIAARMLADSWHRNYEMVLRSLTPLQRSRFLYNQTLKRRNAAAMSICFHQVTYDN